MSSGNTVSDFVRFALTCIFADQATLGRSRRMPSHTPHTPHTGPTHDLRMTRQGRVMTQDRATLTD
jgi:hypothetical protein